MKTVNVTYDCYTVHEGIPVAGETCMNIEMMDDLADRLVDRGTSGIAGNIIERILENAETLKGRHYVRGSIKNYRYANK